MELILLRHSIAQGNREHRFIGVSDVPLTREGRELARKMSAVLPPVEQIYRSPLRRCAETTALLWPDAGETVVDALREIDFGPFEGKTHEELKGSTSYQQWLSVPETVPFVESPAHAKARACNALAWLLGDAKIHGFRLVGVVAHGGTIMSLMDRYGFPARNGYYDWMCANCGGFQVRVGETQGILYVQKQIGGENL